MWWFGAYHFHAGVNRDPKVWSIARVHSATLYSSLDLPPAQNSPLIIFGKTSFRISFQFLQVTI